MQVSQQMREGKRVRPVRHVTIMLRTAVAALMYVACGALQVSAGETLGAAEEAAPPRPKGSDIVKGTGPDAVVPPVAPSKPVIAAKTLFGTARTPAPLATRAIGYYSRGCLAGGVKLAVDGPEWQVMRLSRNRNWGHAGLISFLERLGSDARRFDGWPGLLVGDMSQPRGGPMLTGHASHQVGLDADIWLTPMPPKRMTRQEREDLSATDMLAPSRLAVDPKIWTVDQMRLVKRAASFGEVERIFVHPAIKKAICAATATDVDRTWLSKVRPMWGHDHHFHVRLKCPDGQAGCQAQAPPVLDDGCGKELADWFVLLTAPPKPNEPPEPPKPPLTLENLPQECQVVLSVGATGAGNAKAATTKPAAK